MSLPRRLLSTTLLLPRHRPLHTPTPLPPSRGPPSPEPTQTDFAALDILAATPPPSTAIDACDPTGFALNSGLRVVDAGLLLVGGEAFAWRPWAAAAAAEPAPATPASPRAALRLADSVWGVLDLAWPKPELLVVGTGRTTRVLDGRTRRRLDALGVRVEVLDSRRAAAAFNLLATERGTRGVAAALLPVGG